jgi:hypothetical protein
LYELSVRSLRDLDSIGDVLFQTAPFPIVSQLFKLNPRKRSSKSELYKPAASSLPLFLIYSLAASALYLTLAISPIGIDLTNCATAALPSALLSGSTPLAYN